MYGKWKKENGNKGGVLCKNVKNIFSTADGVDKCAPAWYAFCNFLRKGECVMKMTCNAMSMLMPMCMCRMSMLLCAFK